MSFDMESLLASKSDASDAVAVRARSGPRSSQRRNQTEATRNSILEPGAGCTEPAVVGQHTTDNTKDLEYQTPKKATLKARVFAGPTAWGGGGRGLDL